MLIGAFFIRPVWEIYGGAGISLISTFLLLLVWGMRDGGEGGGGDISLIVLVYIYQFGGLCECVFVCACVCAFLFEVIF